MAISKEKIGEIEVRLIETNQSEIYKGKKLGEK